MRKVSVNSQPLQTKVKAAKSLSNDFRRADLARGDPGSGCPSCFVVGFVSGRSTTNTATSAIRRPRAIAAGKASASFGQYLMLRCDSKLTDVDSYAGKMNVTGPFGKICTKWWTFRAE